MKKRKYTKHQAKEKIEQKDIDSLHDAIIKSGLSITDFAKSRNVAPVTIYRILNAESKYWSKAIRKIFDSVTDAGTTCLPDFGASNQGH